MSGKREAMVLSALLLLTAFNLFPGAALGDTEPNESFATAEQITPGARSGTVTYDTDLYDYYKFTVGPGQILILNGSCGGPNGVRFTYYDPNQTEIANSGWLVQGVFYEFRYTLGQANAGTYYVAADVSKNSGDTAGYNLTLSVMDQSDAGQPGDAGDAKASPRAVTPGSHTGWLADEDELDFYSFAVLPGATINCTLFTPSAATDEFRLELYKPDQTHIKDTGWVAPGFSKALLHTTSDTTGGNYLISLDKKPTDTARGNYSFTVTLTPQNDSGSGSDAAGDINSAFGLPGSGAYAGYVKDDDLSDFYKFSVAGGQIINVQYTAGLTDPGAIRLSLYRPDRSFLGSTGWANPGLGDSFRWMTNNAGGGLYYMQVEKDNTYSFTLGLANQLDAGIAGDAGDELNASRPADTNRQLVGQLGDDDGHDWYSFIGLPDQNVNVSFQVTGGPDKGRVSLYGADKAYLRDTGWVDPAVPAVANLTTTVLGTYYLDIEAGNSSYQFNISVPPSNDTVPPTVAITSPASGSTFQNPTVQLAGTAADNLMLTKVEVSLDGITWSLASGTTSWTATVTLAQGANTLRARATDIAGNINTTSISLTLGGGGDTVQPSIAILSPSDGQKLDSNRLSDIRGTASDDVALDRVDLTVNGIYIPVSVLNNNGEWATGSISLKEGQNTIVATAVDRANNTRTVTITVTYERPRPQPGFEGLALGGAAAVALLLLARKRRA